MFSFDLHKISLQNAIFLANKLCSGLLKPYLSQLVRAIKINQLARTIQAYYIDKGYATTQIKMAWGQTYTKKIVKCFIEDIILHEQTGRDRREMATIFLFLERPLKSLYTLCPVSALRELDMASRIEFQTL